MFYQIHFLWKKVGQSAPQQMLIGGVIICHADWTTCNKDALNKSITIATANYVAIFLKKAIVLQH